jgi:A/G-specific adenine glycosylase
MGSKVASAAIRWFDEHARDLPWRRAGTTPWAILVSEVMLQQTPVSRVLPAYEAWLARWPTPAGLAADPPAEAIRMWGRLGYPRRALRLHQCAQALAADHGGKVPRDLHALLALPGIGTYTARAVAAFAYGQRHPVVDTNVRRLVARVGGAPDAGPSTTAADLAATEALLPPPPALAARASVAFMELGALVCTARAPRCADCPLWRYCGWFAAGTPAAGTGPSRRPQRYAGTDRQVRGILLAALRESPTPVSRPRLDPLWTDDQQRARALTSLLHDGLVVEVAPDRYTLVGDPVDHEVGGSTLRRTTR